jgi:eukaryotic-like serine/threonine-protein kinase
MPSNYLPFNRSGWFYLWCVLITLLLGGNYLGYLQPLERANQLIWSNPASSSLHPSKLIRVIDINFDLDGLLAIKSLEKKYPKASFALAGNFSEEFIKQLEKPSNTSLSKKITLFDGRNRNSAAAIGSAQDNLSYAIRTEKNTTWIVRLFSTVSIQPNLQSNQQSFVWRSSNKLYPSFIAQSIINNIMNRTKNELPIEVSLSAHNQLSIGHHHFWFGFHGEVYPSGRKPQSWLLSSLLKRADSDFSNIIFIDDLSIKNSSIISQTLANVIDTHYLYSSWVTLLATFVLIILCLVGTYKIHRLSAKIKLVFVSVSILILLLIQSFFVSLSLWLSLHMVFLLCTVSWLVLNGYRKEDLLFQEKINFNNELLIDSASIFYKSQNFEKLIPFLNASQPDKSLVDNIYDIAIDAEAHRNLTLAKTLHHWILSHHPKNTLSQARMDELTAEQDQTELDKTLVIDSQGNQSTTLKNSILNIEKFGRYQVDGILGKGAMGVVFQGVDPRINRYVAIKTLQLTDDLDDEVLVETKERFFREAETAGNLSHANIVTIYDVGEEKHPDTNQTLGYIAMDLLTGAPLSEFIKEEKLLPPSLVYQLMIQMTDALEYAHRQNVIHRDIKPANIIFDDELKRGTLTDFGIAYISDHSKTKTGTIMGSPYYMSPEQVIGLKVDGRSDIFSLGVTFYQLLSGQLPFTGESIASVAFHITKTKHESVRNWNKNLPTSAARITNKAMNKSVDKRYQTMAEFKQALINALKRDYKKSPLL